MFGTVHSGLLNDHHIFITFHHSFITLSSLFHHLFISFFSAGNLISTFSSLFHHSFISLSSPFHHFFITFPSHFYHFFISSGSIIWAPCSTTRLSSLVNGPAFLSRKVFLVGALGPGLGVAIGRGGLKPDLIFFFPPEGGDGGIRPRCRSGLLASQPAVCVLTFHRLALRPATQVHKFPRNCVAGMLVCMCSSYCHRLGGSSSGDAG